MTTKRNKREQLAIDTLAVGGYFRKALEDGYRGRSTFKTRLYDAQGRRVEGVGAAALYTLMNEKIAIRDWSVPTGSCFPEEYRSPRLAVERMHAAGVSVPEWLAALAA